MPSLKNSSRGEIFDVEEVETNRQTYDILALHINIAKRMLDIVTPNYVK